MTDHAPIKKDPISLYREFLWSKYHRPFAVRFSLALLWVEATVLLLISAWSLREYMQAPDALFAELTLIVIAFLFPPAVAAILTNRAIRKRVPGSYWVGILFHTGTAVLSILLAILMLATPGDGDTFMGVVFGALGVASIYPAIAFFFHPVRDWYNLKAPTRGDP